MCYCCSNTIRGNIVSGKVSRDKGGRGERLVRDKFRRFFPGAERELNDFQGGLGIDLRETGRFRIQVKHYKQHCSINKIKEVKNLKDTLPLLVSWPTAKGSGKPVVAMYLDDFLEIIDSKKIGAY